MPDLTPQSLADALGRVLAAWVPPPTLSREDWKWPAHRTHILKGNVLRTGRGPTAVRSGPGPNLLSEVPGRFGYRRHY